MTVASYFTSFQHMYSCGSYILSPTALQEQGAMILYPYECAAVWRWLYSRMPCIPGMGVAEEQEPRLECQPCMHLASISAESFIFCHFPQPFLRWVVNPFFRWEGVPRLASSSLARKVGLEPTADSLQGMPLPLSGCPIRLLQIRKHCWAGRQLLVQGHQGPEQSSQLRGAAQSKQPMWHCFGIASPSTGRGRRSCQFIVLNVRPFEIKRFRKDF